jgi:hypothetical protein
VAAAGTQAPCPARVLDARHIAAMYRETAETIRHARGTPHAHTLRVRIHAMRFFSMDESGFHITYSRSSDEF